MLMSAGRIKVILTSVEDDNCSKMFVLSSADCVSAAKASWARECACAVESFELVSGGRVLRGDAPLSSLPALCPGFVELGVEPAVCVSVRLSGSQREPAVMRAVLSAPAEELYEAARALFDLPASRAVRFRAGPVVLEDGSPLRAAGAQEVDLEPGWRLPELRADGSRQEVVVFWSDLLQRVDSRQLRLRCGAATITDTTAAETVLLADLSAPQPLLLEAVRNVAVWQEGALRSAAVWPGGDLPADREVMLQRSIVACRRPPTLPDAWMLHDSLRIVAVGPDKRRAVVHVPRDGCVLDLLSAVPFPGRLEAVLQDHRLPESAPLRVLQAQEVQLRRLPVDIRVRLGARELQWELPEDCVEASFGEIVAGVSPGPRKRQRDQRRILMAGVLACGGCGRKLSRERQGLQRVPSDCCEIRSMRLLYAAKTKPRDARTQTELQTEDSAAQTELQMEDSAAQAEVQTEDSAAQAEVQTEDSAAQAEVLSRNFGAQTKIKGSAEGDVGAAGVSSEGAPKDQQLAVSVRFPDQHVVRCSFGRGDSLLTLSDALRARGQLFRLDDVTLRGRSLICGPDSRLRTLADCGVRDGDELFVKTELPRDVFVVILSINQEFTVTAGRGENCFRKIRPKLPSSVPASCVLLQERLFYRRQGEWRTAVYDDSGSEGCYWDEEDGRKAYAGVGSHLVRELLIPNQGMRAAPRGTPSVGVYDEVVGVTRGQLCGLEASALFDPQFVVYIQALRCSPNRGSEKLFLQLCGGYFEVSSGKIFDGCFEDVLSFARGQGMSVSSSALLLREGDVIPHWSLPRDETICLFRREGVQLKIKDRRLVRPSPTAFQPNVSRWMASADPDDFDEEFYNAVRKLNK